MRQLITNANIIDGTGKPAFLGQVLVENQRIKLVTSDSAYKFGSVDQLIDANFDIVCPGFIDVHSHADLAPFIKNGFKPKVTQGVTCELVGLCGLGVAPVPYALQATLRERLIIGNPDITWSWHDMASYFQAAKAQGLEVNLASFLPHGLLRMQICGDSVRPMTQLELKQLAELANQALAQGAIGISLGLIYHPALYSNKQELQVMAKVAAEHKKPLVVHMRSESDEIIEALEDIINIAQQYQCQLHISHLKIIGRRNAPKLPKLLEIISKHQLTFDQYPYNYGSTTLLSVLPPALLRDYSSTDLYLALARNDIRAQLKDWFSEKLKPSKGEPWDNLPALLGWQNIIVCDVKSIENQQWLGKTILESANLADKHPVDFAIDLLIEEQGQVRMIDYFMDEAIVEHILSSPLGMIGSDTIFGGQLHPRVHGTFPRVISHYAREKHIISLEQAIHKMTNLSATTFNIKHRGKIATGYFADICMFSDEFKDNARIDSPHQVATGLTNLWVNGARKMLNGDYLASKPGEILQPN